MNYKTSLANRTVKTKEELSNLVAKDFDMCFVEENKTGYGFLNGKWREAWVMKPLEAPQGIIFKMKKETDETH